MISRQSYRLLLLTLVASASLISSTCSATTSGTDGRIDPRKSFEAVIPDLMGRWGVAGGAVGLVKDEKLVYVEGFGWADKDGGIRVEPESLFRIASLSKPLTAVSVLKLVEDGLLTLDDRPFVLLDDLKPASAPGLDSRIYDVTVRDLLQHSGGFDREAGFDPMFRSTEIARDMGVSPPAGPDTVISYMYNRALDFVPGARYAYSNFGYCVLGRIIERTAGKGYEEYVRESVLGPMGISAMRTGKSRRSERLPGEVVYYDYPGAPLSVSVFPDQLESVPWPYGGFYLEAMDAHGGWVASAVDLLRFVCHVDKRPLVPDLLDAASIDLMTARPAVPDWAASSWYYALGWQIRPVGGDGNWWHTGSLPGTSTLLVRAAGGLAWVALFNSRPQNFNPFMLELDQAMWRAVEKIDEWPSEDLFGSYPAKSTGR